MTILVRLGALALFALILSPQPSAAAAIDCDRAFTADELTICQRNGLMRLDRELASLFDDAMNAAHADLKYMLREGQASWLRARNRCARDRRCIRRHYRARIRELSGFLNEDAAAPAPQPPAGCILFSEANFGGESVTINPNQQVSFFGTEWDNKASSVRVGRNCRLTAFSRAFYNGRQIEYANHAADMGRLNNRASSVQCACR